MVCFGLLPSVHTSLITSDSSEHFISYLHILSNKYKVSFDFLGHICWDTFVDLEDLSYLILKPSTYL